LIDLDSAGYGEFFVVPVHDEILVDLPAELADEAMREIPEIMSNTTDYSVNILAESEGPLLKWGEKYE
jgi:DNA polymerase-1